MENILPTTTEEFHNDVKVWKSNIALVNDELRFIENLTQSSIFEPRTPNLFERLELFKSQVIKMKSLLDTIKTLLTKHEVELSGMLECDTVSCDTFFIKRHRMIKEQYRQFVDTYNTTKIEIFNYCGTILKTSKEKTKN